MTNHDRPDPTAVESTAVDPTAVDPTAVDPTAVDPTAVDPATLAPPSGDDRPFPVPAPPSGEPPVPPVPGDAPAGPLDPAAEPGAADDSRPTLDQEEAGAPAPTGAETTCPQCGAEVRTGDRFCEECGYVLSSSLGAALDATPVAPDPELTVENPDDGPICVHCEEGHVDTDGYCRQCGRKQPDPRDHIEQDEEWLAAVSDKGLRHHRNEDSMAMQVTPDAVVMVVCDGVTSSLDPQIASRIAAETTCATIVGDLAQGRTDLDQIMSDAVAAAQHGVAAIAGTTPEALSGSRGDRVNAPSCTWSAAVIRNGIISAASVGDSRVYLIAPDGSDRLTTDDSWAAEVVAAGMMSEEVAELQPQAHAITGWLGADAPPIKLRVRHQAVVPGLLMACSDGLWNYASSAVEMTRVVNDASSNAPTLLDRTRNLVRFAIDQGGHDNITVVAADLSALPARYLSEGTDSAAHLPPPTGEMPDMWDDDGHAPTVRTHPRERQLPDTGALARFAPPTGVPHPGQWDPPPPVDHEPGLRDGETGPGAASMADEASSDPAPEDRW